MVDKVFDDLIWEPTPLLLPLSRWIMYQKQNRNWLSKLLVEVVFSLPQIDDDNAIPLNIYSLEELRLNVESVMKNYTPDATRMKLSSSSSLGIDGLAKLVKEQRDTLKLHLSILSKVYQDLGLESHDRGYRFKYQRILLEKFGKENSEKILKHSYSEEIIYIAEGLLAGLYPKGKEEVSKSLHRLADQLILSFSLLCLKLEVIGYTWKDATNFSQQAGYSEIISMFNEFESHYKSFEYSVYYHFFESHDPLIKEDEVNDYECIQWLGILLLEGIRSGLSHKAFSVDDVEAVDPNVLITVPRIGLIESIRGGLFRDTHFLYILEEKCHQQVHQLESLIEELSESDYQQLISSSLSSDKFAPIFKLVCELCNQLESYRKGYWIQTVTKIFKMAIEQNIPAPKESKSSFQRLLRPLSILKARILK